MSRSVFLGARMPAAVLLSLLVFMDALVISAPQVAADSRHTEPVRFATFNASLNRNFEGQALADLSTPYSPAEADAELRGRRAQAAAVAEIIQRVRPEILLINEFDYVEGPVDGNALTDAFQANYLAMPQKPELEGITYPYVFVAPSNTGIHSGFDLNNNGAVVSTPLAQGYGDDALGFGEFPGKFGMAVFSQHPIRYTRSGRSRTSSGPTCPERCSRPTRPAGPSRSCAVSRGTPMRSSPCFH